MLLSFLFSYEYNSKVILKFQLSTEMVVGRRLLPEARLLTSESSSALLSDHASVCLCLPTSEMGMILAPTSQSCCED